MVRDGDRIIIDSGSRTIEWLVTDAEQANRKREWNASGQGKLIVNRGVLFRYARDVAVSIRFSYRATINEHHTLSPPMWARTATESVTDDTNTL